MQRRRIVITGMGLVTPLGRDLRTSWRALCRGVRAVRRVRLAAPGHTISGLGAPAVTSRRRAVAAVGAANRSRNPAVQAGVSTGDAFAENRTSTGSEPIGWLGSMGETPTKLQRLAQAAAAEAIEQAGFAGGISAGLAERFGCAIGSSKGDLEAIAGAAQQYRLAGEVDSRLWEAFFPNALAVKLARTFGLAGPASCPVGACTTGVLAVVQAAHWIVDGACDVALAGSADASLVPVAVASYQRMGVLAPADWSDPRSAVRPFAADRRGFAIGEGAGMFVLESAEHAERRGVAPVAELAGWSVAGDATSIADLSPSPAALVRCIGDALERAGVPPEAIGHVNCHGTATRANDPWETAALRDAFGPHAKKLRLTANKSMIGHLLGAAGSVELGFTALALCDRFVPPTRNLDYPDPACDLDYTGEVGVAADAQASLKLSIGFGGHLAAVVLRRLPDCRRWK